MIRKIYHPHPILDRKLRAIYFIKKHNQIAKQIRLGTSLDLVKYNWNALLYKQAVIQAKYEQKKILKESNVTG